MHPSNNTTLMASLLLAIRSRNEIATRQLLQTLDNTLDNPESSFIRLYNTLDNISKLWLTSTISPGLSKETYSEANQRILKNITEI